MAIAKDGHPIQEIRSPEDLESMEPHIIWLDTQSDDLVKIAAELKTYLKDAPANLTRLSLTDAVRVQSCVDFVSIDEYVLSVNGQTDPQFSYDTVKLLVGRNFLVTIHSSAIPRLDACRQRFLANDQPLGHYCSPATVATALLQGFLTQTVEALDRVSPYLNDLNTLLDRTNDLPASALSEVMPRITKNMAKLEQYMTNYPTIAHTFAEFQPSTEGNGSNAAYQKALADSLGVVMGLVGTIKGMINRRQIQCDEIRDNHQTKTAERQTISTEKLTKKANLLTVAGTILGLAGAITSTIQAAGTTLDTTAGQTITAGWLTAFLFGLIWARRNGYLD
jgi:Mg2+ and Co2+ transporter CorA